MTYRNKASRPAFRRLLQEIDDAGYHCRWAVLNAADYGVPQERERLFVMGAQRGLRLPAYPEPSTRAAGTKQRLLYRPAGPSCADAIGDLPNADDFRDFELGLGIVHPELDLVELQVIEQVAGFFERLV